ncbi:MAG: hypothetical protein ACYC69_10370 [Thermodesulfovibrionales bacterium]
MSSVAIISIGCATAGSVALAAALLALGLGLAVGFLLSSLNKMDDRTKDNILSDVNNVLYRLRNEISQMDEHSREELSEQTSKLRTIEEDIKNLLKNDKIEGVEKAIIALNVCIAETRKNIEIAKLKQQESFAELEFHEERISGIIGSMLPALPEGALKSETEEVKREFIKIINEIGASGKIDELADIEKRLGILFQKHLLTKGINTASADEDKAEFKNSENEDKKERLKGEIRKFYSLIEKLDPAVCLELGRLVKGIETETYIQRIEMVNNNIKLRYGQLKEALAWTAVYRDVLQKLHQKLALYEGSGQISASINEILEARYINKTDYESMLMSAAEFISHAEEDSERKRLRDRLAQKIKGGLEGLGYAVISEGDDLESLENEKIVYLDTRWEDYKVMMRLSEGQELVTRLVKVVPTEADMVNMSEYQKQKDIEVAKQWCKDYDEFLGRLGSEGIGFNVKLRKEPDVENVFYVVSEALASREAERSKNKEEMKRRLDG